MNASGRLNFLFRVRLAEHKDKTMQPVIILDPSSGIKYGKNTIEVKSFINDVKDVRDENLCLTSLNSTSIDSSTFEKQHTKLFEMLERYPNVKGTIWKVDKNNTEHYDEEVNDFRKTHCPICMEPFSNRPLEGFNCVYRKLEREFLKKKGLPDQFQLENSENHHLREEYMKYVSSRITASEESRRSDHNNGMHIFHKDCLRRWIQLQAINIGIDEIVCPTCRYPVYDKNEKETLLCNIHDVACRLYIGISDDTNCLKCDDIINLKKNQPSWTAPRIMHDFGKLQEMKQTKAACKIDDEKSCLSKDPERFIVFLEKYIETTTPSFTDDVIRKEKSPIPVFDKFMDEPQSTEKAIEVMTALECKDICRPLCVF